MAANLNLSVVLKADASGLKGELRGAAGEIKGIGTAAQSAASASAGAFTRIRGQLTGLIKGASGGFSNFAYQLQDIAGGLATGQSPFTVLMQQGPQILSALGPQGVVIGALVAGAGLAAKAILGFEQDSGAAVESAAKRIDGAMKSMADSLGKGVPAVAKLREAFAELDPSLRGLDVRRQRAAIADITGGIEEADAEFQRAIGEIENAARTRLSIGGSGRADLGGAAGELTRAQAETVLSIAERFNAAQITNLQVLNELDAVAGGAGEVVAGLADAMDLAASKSQEGELALKAATEAVAGLAQGVENEGGRIVSQLRGVDAATERTGNAFEELYNRVVGQSYVPDMVTEAGGWFDRLKEDMTSKTGEATSAVSEAFAGLDRQVSYRLGSMIAHNKIALTDFADFAQDILGQILGGLIGVGIQAGIGAAFASSPAAPQTGPGGLAVGGGATSQIFHSGGIVGAPGAPTRRLPWSTFFGAQRYHAGGTVLGRDEVPIIAKRGERVVPAGRSAGGVTVNVIDQRSGGQAVETRERRGAGGELHLDVMIRDLVDRGMGRGDHDRSMFARFGIRPALGSR